MRSPAIILLAVSISWPIKNNELVNVLPDAATFIFQRILKCYLEDFHHTVRVAKAGLFTPHASGSLL